MHSKKQRLALVFVGLIAQADGEIDDVEAEFFGNIATVLGIKP
jgi:tellurite resistance protein